MIKIFLLILILASPCYPQTSKDTLSVEVNVLFTQSGIRTIVYNEIVARTSTSVSGIYDTAYTFNYSSIPAYGFYINKRLPIKYLDNFDKLKTWVVTNLQGNISKIARCKVTVHTCHNDNNQPCISEVIYEK